MVLVCVAACGRIGFDPFGGNPDDAATNDAITDGTIGDGQPITRKCHTMSEYMTATGLTNTYREGTQLVPWAQARLLCQADDADLWVVESALEASSFTGDWTGITDAAGEGVWRKLDGTIAMFLPFQAGEPDGGTEENCLRSDSAGFEDRECTDDRDYVCECPAP